MQNNVGTQKINKEGKVPGLNSKVWLDEQSIANIFSFSKLSNQYHIKYDNNIEDVFYVGDKRSGKYWKFPKNREGLYTFEYDKKYNKALCNMEGKSLVETVVNNIEGYSNN